MNYPPDRHGDNRWNQCLDALIAAWNKHGPDITLATLTWLNGDEPGDAATGTEGAALCLTRTSSPPRGCSPHHQQTGRYGAGTGQAKRTGN